jgi:LysR family transcriptional regulator, hydrogen peroxide-inducible genes activator
LICEDLFREPFFVVVPPKHHLASRKMIDLQEIRTDPFLLLKEGHCFREKCDHGLPRVKAAAKPGL